MELLRRKYISTPKLHTIASEGCKIFKDLEKNLFSQLEESFLTYINLIFVFKNAMFLSFLKNHKNMTNGATI